MKEAPIGSALHKARCEAVANWFIRNVKEKCVRGLGAEFQSLRQSLNPAECKAFYAQPEGTRNRYRDIVCLDATRVPLKGQPNDYIHANFVTMPKDSPKDPRKKFICTQAPKDSTCLDFWNMIWQEKSPVILMLCNFYEKNRHGELQQKCFEYFPTEVNASVTFGNFKITCTKQEIMPEGKQVTIRISSLTVCNGKEQTNITHYQWVDWPDQGVPPGDQVIIKLLEKLRDVKPITVHCSAGIGRTGTIVMFQYVLDRYELGEPFAEMDQVLMDIRRQRALSVQTPQQYIYVTRVLLEHFVSSQFPPWFDVAGSLACVRLFMVEYRKVFQGA